jgi:predicted transcriptional regulator
MPSITIKLPPAMSRKLRSAATRKGESLSTLARRALVREIEAPAPDFAKLAAPYLGMFRGPDDLSSREGYGR